MPTHQELIDILRDGENNAAFAEEIEAVLSIEPDPRTSTPTRTFVRNAIIQDQLPIGSNRDGYYLINNEEEFNRAITGLQDRIDAMNRRIDALRTGWQRRTQSRENGGNWPK